MCGEETHLPCAVNVALNRHALNQSHSYPYKESPFSGLGMTKGTKHTSVRVNGVFLALNCKWAAFSQGNCSHSYSKSSKAFDFEVSYNKKVPGAAF